MKKSLLDKVKRMLDEERDVQPDVALLTALDSFAADESHPLEDMPPQERRAIYEFVWKSKSVFLAEVLRSAMSSDILIEAMFVLMLEVGYRWGLRGNEARHSIPVDFPTERAGNCSCGSPAYVCSRCHRAFCEELLPSIDGLCPYCFVKSRQQKGRQE